jgi:cytidylate kinase
MMTLSDYIQDVMIAEGLYDPSIFKAIFLAGGPGSGKSFMAKKIALQALGFVIINSDQPFENLMRKLELDFKMPESEKEQRDAAREVAKATADKKQMLAIHGRLGLVIDGTGKDMEKILKMRGHLAVKGYDSALVFINTDLETALARNAKRERSVPEDIATNLWKDVQRNLGVFQRAFGSNFHIVDNSEGADFETQTTRVYKSLLAWSKEPPKNGAAQAWIRDQKQRRNITENVSEAAYAGNIGVMELVKFQQVASDVEKKHLKHLIANKKTKDAWKLVQDKLGVKLVGKSFGN